MAERNNWTREQTMMAFALYRILPSGKWDQHNLTIQKLADHIHRSPSAVVFKLGNLASLDENRMTKGLTNHSKLDQKIWDEYAERRGRPSRHARRFRRGTNRRATSRLRPSGCGHRTNQPAVFPQHACPQLPRPLLHHRNRDRPAAHRQPHQTMEGFVSNGESGRIERPVAERVPRQGFRPGSDHPRQRFRDSCLAARRAHGNQRRMAVPLRRTAHLPTCRLQPIPRIPRIPSRAYLSTLIPKHPYN